VGRGPKGGLFPPPEQAPGGLAPERTGQARNATKPSQTGSEPEAGWLAERIGRDGRLHQNEKALLRFLKQESPRLHESLQPLLDRAA
jgi:hypothetical protein